MQTAPHGSWSSPLTAGRVAAGARRLSQPRLRAGGLTWLEGRPEEGGRQVVVELGADGRVRDLTPAGVNVRTRVHEYGGGDYGFCGEQLVYVALGVPGIQRLGAEPVPGTRPAAGYADFRASPDGRWLLAVEEEPRQGGEPANRLVAFDLREGRRIVVWDRSDFVSSARFRGDGRALAFLSWEHPRMPWDGTELRVLAWGASGPEGAPRTVAGGPGESVFQPCFSPAGHLSFASDRTGFWNLFQERGGRLHPLCPRSAEFGLPQWVFGMATFGFASEEVIVCTWREDGVGRLGRLEVASGRLEPFELPYCDFDGLDVDAGAAAFVGGAPAAPAAVCHLDLGTGRCQEMARAFELEVDPGLLSRPEPLRFRSVAGRESHAILYRPRNPDFRGPSGDRPPLLVKSHGGPTAATTPALKLGVQYWTSRGFAVLDVNYGGSSGYGRAYRELLRGAWGVVDVDDCTEAARYVAKQGLAHEDHLAITGGSAGGYTTLCCLTFRDLFAAGASHYGIGDLEALARDTHKFESRYLEGLVGPWPEARERYRERSPIYHTELLARPVIFFQGLEDRVVPPAQAEAMVAALAARGVPHAYVAFPGEQHGFRRAENIRAALEGELSFYGQVLGFSTDARPDPPLEIRRGPAGG